MIERVAEAIEQVMRSNGVEFEAERSVMRDIAKAVLTAMRDPTEAMLSAAAFGSDQPAIDAATRETVIDPWRAMIDAALAEG
jgi:hypothetical protein